MYTCSHDDMCTQSTLSFTITCNITDSMLHGLTLCSCGLEHKSIVFCVALLYLIMVHMRYTYYTLTCYDITLLPVSILCSYL